MDDTRPDDEIALDACRTEDERTLVAELFRLSPALSEAPFVEIGERLVLFVESIDHRGHVLPRVVRIVERSARRSNCRAGGRGLGSRS